jgi:hypothetical protein
MCFFLPAAAGAAAAGSAAATASAISAATAVVGAVTSVAGLGIGVVQAQAAANAQAQQAQLGVDMQAQQNHLQQVQLSRSQSLEYRQQALSSRNQLLQSRLQNDYQRNQLDLQYRQGQLQHDYEVKNTVTKHMADVKAQQSQMLAYQNQLFYNGTAANQVMVAEQQKLQEARAKAAFRMQDIYAKSIGSAGAVLATGATGQSVGLLVQDADRQAGFAIAQEEASLDSATIAASTQIDRSRTDLASADAGAYSKLTSPIAAPIFAPKPVGIGRDLGIGIPTYNWRRT